MDKRKPFEDIQTDAEYLRAVGMGPGTNPELWIAECPKCRSTAFIAHAGTACRECRGWNNFEEKYTRRYLALHDIDPARKWENLANAILVLGPEMDRRLFSYECFIENLTHTDLLEAFYNAHAQGDE